MRNLTTRKAVVCTTAWLACCALLFFGERVHLFPADKLVPTKLFHNLTGSPNCSFEHWVEIKVGANDKFALVAEDVCNYLTTTVVGFSSMNPVLQRLQILSLIRQKFANVWRTFWKRELASTTVLVVIATKDRPALLHLVLEHLFACTSSTKVIVLYEASEQTHANAYQRVFIDFPLVTAWDRTQNGGYFSSLLKVAQQQVTNVVVCSDDTVFIRNVDLKVHGLTQRLLAGTGFRVTTQFRISYPLPSNSPPILAHVVIENLPDLYLTDCTRDNTPHLCYDRHIDGPLYLRSHLLAEWPSLPNPDHPGEFEGRWIGAKLSYDVLDFTLFPAEQVLFNAGGSQSTVRAENFVASSQEKNAADRVRSSAKVLDGCKLFLMDNDVQSNHDTHRSSTFGWKCPTS